MALQAHPQRLGCARRKHSSARHSVRTHATSAQGGGAVVQQELRIRLRSFTLEPLKQACRKITDAAEETGAQYSGPVMLPVKKRVYTVLRSPFVDKDAKDHYEVRTHNRLIDIKNPTARTVDSLMSLDLPAGVGVEVKL